MLDDAADKVGFEFVVGEGRAFGRAGQRVEFVPAGEGRKAGRGHGYLSAQRNFVERDIVGVAEVAAHFHFLVQGAGVPAAQTCDGHGGVGVQRTAIVADGVAHIKMVAIGYIYGHAEIAEDNVFAPSRG